METYQNVSASLDSDTSKESRNKLLFWKKKKGSIFNIRRKKATYDISNYRNVEQVINFECNIQQAINKSYINPLPNFCRKIMMYATVIANR